MSKLDKTDLKLIAELENDSRQTASQIAKKLGTSQQVVSYRISSLQERKVIGGFYTVIDFSKLGYTSYRTMIRLSSITEGKLNEITTYLTKHPNILWLVECGGRYDLIINFLAKNVHQYSKMFKEFQNKFPNQIQNYDILTTIEGNYFGRDYFTSKTRKLASSSKFGSELSSTKRDETDLEILNQISENAKMNSVEIAEKINVSPNTVISKIKNMKKSGIIQGFKPLIHLEETPFSSYKATVKLQNITEKKEKEMIEYLHPNAHILGIIKLIGAWGLEIEFEVETKEQMLELTRDFRDKFESIIKEFEVIPLFHEYKYNFFPRDLLD